MSGAWAEIPAAYAIRTCQPFLFFGNYAAHLFDLNVDVDEVLQQASAQEVTQST
jgi:hypothetical protein